MMEKVEKVAVKLSEADKIWDEIKDSDLGIYGLPDQKVSDHVSRVSLPGDSLYLKLKSSAVLVALEDSLNKVTDGNGNSRPNVRFEFELVDGFVVVSRVKPTLKEIK